ncbi:MAG: ABC transporter permease, partial [Polyangiales bacterium]
INPMLVTAKDKTATGVLMKGVDPYEMPKILDLPQQVTEGTKAIKDGDFSALRRVGAKPPPRTKSYFGFPESGDHPRLPPSSVSASASAIPSIAPLAPIAPAPSSTVTARDKSKDGAKDSTADDPFVRDMEASLARRVRETAELNAQLDEVSPTPPAAPAPAPSAQAPAGAFDDGDSAGGLPSDSEEDAVVTDLQKAAAAKETDLPGVIIGKTLAETLGVGLGDRVRVTSPAIGFSFSGSARAPIARQFQVIAIFEAGFDQYDSKLVYVDLYEAQAFYDQGDSVTGVEMRVRDIDKARAIRDDIDARLGNGIYHVMDWEELNHPLFTALRIQQIGMSAVLALIIIVAAFTVIATLIMIVLDKRKEIAVLKAMGARDGAILRAFLYQGLIIGGIGTSTGLALGLFFCKVLLRWGFPLDPHVYFISRLPVEVRPQEFLLTGLIAILICLAATVVPALHAARIRPADGLRAQ